MSCITLCCLQQECNGFACGSDCDFLTVAATTVLCTDNNLAKHLKNALTREINVLRGDIPLSFYATT